MPSDVAPMENPSLGFSMHFDVQPRHKRPACPSKEMWSLYSKW